ncbi:MAG: hypothetical protein QNJ69_02945 [Gammaproteobacteria bacterium]|nr:hypothetical protein [Gammaproteobacteria bacterium]
MRSGFWAICLALMTASVFAADRWQFSSRTAISAQPSSGLFHQLGGAGRKHIAIAGQSVAVVWEDNRNGDPQVYAAVKQTTDQAFSPSIQVSAGSESYEPTIASVADGVFAISWEQDAEIHVRLLLGSGLSDAVRLSTGTAAQATIAAAQAKVYVAWPEQSARQWTLKVARLGVSESRQLTLESTVAVEAQALATPLLFPTLAAKAEALCVAWEDRRAGHTRILSSFSGDQGLSFSPPQNLNEFYSNRNAYDMGNGVTRVALAAFGEDEVVATWMDKRRGGAGYGIFASLGADGGEFFGPNEKVHGEQGDRQPHYNPAAAGNMAGEFVVAWDDFRRGDSDIWLSSYNDDMEWSEDFAPPVAAGQGEQSHPSIALDEQGNLHLVWIERADLAAPTRLWYSFGQRVPD